MERHKVATVDIPWSFIQAEMEGETVHMKLEGEMSELLKNLTQSYIGSTCQTKKGGQSFMGS